MSQSTQQSSDIGGNEQDWVEALDTDLAQEPHEKIQAAMQSLEIAPQQGVEHQGDRLRIPGRVALMPITLLQTLTACIGFALATLYFAREASQYLMPLAVVQIVLFSQIALYHTSFRALRKGLALFHALFTALFIVFVCWALTDYTLHIARAGSAWLVVLANIAFALLPLLMLVHWVYLGRSYRWVKV